MYCGADCLAYVEKRRGRRLSRSRAARLAGTNRNGTRAEGLLLALDLLGYRARLCERLSWAKLKGYAQRGNVVIVSWWSDLDAGDKRPVALPADGHWSVVEKVTRETVTLYDPDAPTLRELPRKFFESRWYDYDIAPDGTRRDLIQAAVVARDAPPRKQKARARRE